MAVVSVEAVEASGGGSVMDRTYQAVYRVTTDARSDGPNTVRLAAGIPAYNSSYAFAGDVPDTGAFCIEKVASLEEAKGTAKRWLVTCSYSTKDRQDCETTDITDPLQIPPQISFSFINRTRYIEKDIDDRPFQSSALEPYPPVEVDDSRPAIIITRNEASIDPGFLAEYKDKVNSDEIWGLEPRQVKIANITAEKRFRGSCTPYYQVTYEFHVAQETWDLTLFDRGFRKLKTPGSPHLGNELILDEKSQPLQTEAWLDGNGDVLDLDDDPVELDPFKLYEEVAFSALSLPEIP